MTILELINEVAEELGVSAEKRLACTEVCRQVHTGADREIPEEDIPTYRAWARTALEETLAEIN